MNSIEKTLEKKQDCAESVADRDRLYAVILREEGSDVDNSRN